MLSGISDILRSALTSFYALVYDNRNSQRKIAFFTTRRVEQEELEILQKQLEAARRDEELLRKRCRVDESRRQIEAQQRTNSRLRGIPNLETLPNVNKYRNILKKCRLNTRKD